MDILEKDGKLICQKYNHNEPIMMIAMEDSLPIKERLLCVKCLQINRTIQKITGIEQVKEMIKEKKNQMRQKDQQQSSKDLQIIKEFLQKMINIQTQMIKDFEEIQRITKQWINEIERREDNTQLISLIKGIEMLNQQYDNDQRNKINHSYSNKLYTKIIRLINNDINKTHHLLKQFLNKQLVIYIDSRNQLKQKVVNVNKLITTNNIKLIRQKIEYKSKEWCFAIAFNNNGQIMVTGCNYDIKVWKFEKGQMIENKKLNGHTYDVYCFVFSKKINWFASGSQDKTIRCWKEQTNGEWISTQPGQQHTNDINCILLNSNENELISCSYDKTIKVWKVNCQSNQLDYNYTLDQKHTDFVYSISMNEQETYLVSCSRDTRIILWNKDNQNKWKYQNEIVNDDWGYRLCFISDYQIIWQQQRIGVTHFFEIKNGQLIRRPELNIQLNKESGDHYLFPTIFNKRKQIIVQSHNRYVYFLKKQENDILALASDPIDCNNTCNYGSLTDDGEYLVVWDNGSKEIRVHQIQYK